MEEYIELNIMALSKSTSVDGNFVLVLEDAFEKRRLPIIIGHGEAQYIGIILENLKTKRPLTHELLANVINTLSAKVEKVIIKDKVDDIFYADIILISSIGDQFTIDTRVSDAIALAIRMEVPIYIKTDLMKNSGTINEIYVSTTNKTLFTDYTLNELEDLLQKVVLKEDYESAIRIREAIQKHKNKN